MLVGSDPEKIEAAFKTLLSNNWKQGQIPELWDGNAAQRIANHIIEIYNL